MRRQCVARMKVALSSFRRGPSRLTWQPNKHRRAAVRRGFHLQQPTSAAGALGHPAQSPPAAGLPDVEADAVVFHSQLQLVLPACKRYGDVARPGMLENVR